MVWSLVSHQELRTVKTLSHPAKNPEIAPFLELHTSVVFQEIPGRDGNILSVMVELLLAISTK